MLYLLNYYNNRDEIKLFAIDFFNDVTGIDSLAKKCFDVQSKGVKNIQPAMLGDYLVTLYKNFLSELNFVDFILFIQSVSPTLKNIIGVKSSFSFKELNDDQRLSVKKPLISAAKKIEDIDLNKITDDSAEEFLEKDQFVIDNKTCEEYIRDLIKLDSSIELNNTELKKIFKEIRDKQSSKKITVSKEKSSRV